MAEIRRCENWIDLQHRFAEHVRLCSVAPSRFHWNDLKEACVVIQELLARHVHGVKFSITVKVVQNRRLKSVLRDSEQDLARRKAGDDIALGESPVYQRFRVSGKDWKGKRFVHIPDVQTATDAKSFHDRAQKGCFRSILAFPLRVPVYQPAAKDPALGTGIAKNLRGFLSIDAPVPNTFYALFHPALGAEQSRDLREELHAFFGIADSIATIIMLKDSSGSDGSKKD